MYLFTSESVSPGHPDKCADIIADSIVDKYIMADSNSRVASEVFVAGNKVVIGGEVKSQLEISDEELQDIAINALKKIGYTGNNGFSRQECIHPDEVKVFNYLNRQSDDIGQGVDQSSGEIGAGDQGIMFGFASAATSSYMPSAITYSRQICNTVYDYALANPNEFGIDIKTQVTMDYITKSNFEFTLPMKIHTIVVSAPSVRDLSLKKVISKIKELIVATNLPKNLFDIDSCIIHINPTGRYVNHSSLHDSGLTGRKLIVDSYGGYAPIGGGAQSSKDYTKVDRSGLYASRWIAKHIVAAGLAKKALVQLSYAIGIAKPVSVSVDLYGTDLRKTEDEVLSEKIAARYGLTPKWITEKFKLDKPSSNNFLYADIAARGQVGLEDYPWEQLDDLDWYRSLS